MKVSQFNVFTPSFFEGTTLVYNTLSGSFLAMDDEEFSRALNVLAKIEDGAASEDFADDRVAGTLRQCGLIVEEDVDERSIVRERYWQKNSDAKSALALTIAPTVSCNFGCTYCFQDHPKRHMSAENVAAIKQYVRTQIRSATGLFITWFGGEPLLAFETIRALTDYFTELCSEVGVPFHQSMITNGFLLEGERLAYLARQNNFTYIQITLDGPPVYHDKRRFMVSGKPTFEKIVSNIEAAADQLPITVRVNVDKTNASSLDEFVVLLKERGLRDRITVYLGHVLPYTHVCEDVEDVALTHEEFAALEANFQFTLFSEGFRPSVSLPKPRFGHLCVADNPNGAVLAPDNLVFRCWNEVTESSNVASGSLKGGDETFFELPVISQSANRDAWKNYDPFTHEMCQQCLVQPLCQGGCPWEARKNPEWSTGNCTPLKFNLPDRLRLYHMMRTIDAHPALEEAQELNPDAVYSRS